MITRRSFLAAAVLPALGLASGAVDGEEPQRYTDVSREPVPEGYPHDRPLPTLRSPVMAPLPRRVVAGYWTYWGSPTRLRDIPAQYNTVFLFHATPVGGAPGSTGAVQWNTPDDGRGAATHLLADLAEFRRTRTAILTVGGARAHVDLSTRARAQAFLDSVLRIYGDLGGFDGLDWNTYEGDQQPNTEQMIWVSRELKARFGQDFAITTPPAPWRQVDVAHCRAMVEAGVLDMVSPQYYDGPGLATEAHIVRSVTEWVARMGDASRVGVGFGLATRPQYSSRATVRAAWEILAGRHPGLRGGFNWNLATDEGMGWPFAEQIAPRMVIEASSPPIVPPLVPVPLLALRYAPPQAPSTDPGPSPEGAATTAAGTGTPRLPDTIVGTEWSVATGPRIADVPPECTVVWIAAEHAAGAGGDDKAPDVRDRAGTAQALTAGIALLRRRASPPRIVLTATLGADDAPELTSAGSADALAAEAVRTARELRLDGFCWALGHAPRSVAASVERVSRAIVTEMRRTDPGFSLTVIPRTTPGADPGHDGTAPVHADVVRRCRDILDAVLPQYPAQDDRLQDARHLRADVQGWLDCGLRPDQVGLLVEARWGLVGADGSPVGTPVVPERAWAALTAEWPGLRHPGTWSPGGRTAGGRPRRSD
ncbi:hypothetical protein E7744_05135 [Citricoccus sp. SGAir0253]|uniref:glycosyl hydrolase family 18 protein n=1 Tax=Citricoccus sp. SGAir0253 TaxID=2567881 RepID=UPI0010CD0D01|nr:glycosyl hydrolase family 18 protein [Citricoccus sp. SGAir0253]QCU77654.1 hypothetical protein E7744_05135 [Citricoccus sp. SGAir0253]